MKKYDLGEASKIVLDQNGWVNPCFFVNDTFVFRFNARDPHLPKFQREFFVFDLLRKLALPVPRQVILDDSKSFVAYDVLISEMLPGKNLEADGKNLSDENKKIVAQEAGKLLDSLHSISFDFFGELADQGPLPKTRTWIEYLEAKLSFHLNEAKQLGIFDQKESEHFWSVFQLHIPFLSVVKSASLVHGDYHFGNLLHLNSSITGVLDFEWAFAGDPLYDYFQWNSDEDLWPLDSIPFIKSGEHSEFSFVEKKRMDIYQMIRNIDLCSVAQLHFDAKEAKEYRETTMQQVSSLIKI